VAITLNNRALVTIYGGSGFIGRHLVASLAAAGLRVTVPSRRRERAKHLILLPTVDVVQTDIMAPGVLERLQDHEAAALTAHEAVALGVEGP